MAAQIAPSILNANLLELGSEIKKIVNDADWLHFDVMDGHFVPNLTFGPMFVSAIKSISQLPIEAHLMVDNPDFFIPLYAEAGSQRIIIHPEGVIHLHRLIHRIKEYKCEVGLALNPATSLQSLEYVLKDLDLVLIMGVDPGFGGQKMIPDIIYKIKSLAEMIKEMNPTCKIEVDGGVNWENASTLIDAGVNILVAGTLIFRDPDPRAAVVRLKQIINKGGNSTVI